MNSFISSLHVLFDVIRAFGPVVASGFLGWVAYNQFKLAKSQSKISQEQLALAKQQADIAQRKVELDIRDKKYDIFKRWNEAHYNIIESAGDANNLQGYIKEFHKLAAISDELRCIMIDHEDFHQSRVCIINSYKDILLLKEKLAYSKFVNNDSKKLMEGVEVFKYNQDYMPIYDKIVEHRNKLLTIFYKELKL